MGQKVISGIKMFEAMYNFWYMNGYGVYVWPCYILLLLTLSIYILQSIRRNILTHQKLKSDQ